MLATGCLVFFFSDGSSATSRRAGRSRPATTANGCSHYGLWAAGAFTIGLGVLPVVAALAGLVRPKDEPRTPQLRAFTALLGAAVVGFGLYTAVKAAYLSTAFGTVIVERNLIYLVPLVFCGMALWLERPRLLWVPLAVATAVVACLLVFATLPLSNVPYSDALGLSIAQMSNRNLAFTDGDVRWTLVVVLVISVCLLLAPRFLRGRPRAVIGILVATGALVLAWTLTGEISAAKYSNDSGKLITKNFPRPLSWLDRVTARRAGALPRAEHRAGRRARHLADGVLEPVIEVRLEPRRHRAEAWARADARHSCATDGRLTPDPGVRYVVVEPGTDLDGKVVARPPQSPGAGRSTSSTARSVWPTRRQASSRDGWMGAEAARTTSTRREAVKAATSSSPSRGRPGAAPTSPATW